MPERKRRLPGTATDFSENGEVPIDADRLAAAKEAEAEAEDRRLRYGEEKARYHLARSEYELFVAKRNRLISLSNEPKEVREAHRDCSNAKSRMLVAKGLAAEAKEEWKDWEERLVKALTETLPLFDDVLLKNG